MASTFLRVHGERFEFSEAALERCGSDSMLVQAAGHEGEQLNWPFSVAAFSKVLEWANTGMLPQPGSLPQAEMTEVSAATTLSRDPILTWRPPSENEWQRLTTCWLEQTASQSCPMLRRSAVP